MTDLLAPSFVPETTTGTDTAAEQAIIGAMMIDPSIVPEVMEVVKSDDFFHRKHATLFNLIIDRFAQGEPVDPISIASALADIPGSNGKGNLLAQIGGAGYLHTLMTCVTAVDSAPYHAEIVRKRAVRRKVHAAGIGIMQLATESTCEADELPDKAVHLLRTASAGTSVECGLSPNELFDQMVEYMDEMSKGGCVHTGFHDLDKVIGAGRAGQLIIIAGRPGSGKTVFAGSIARNMAMRQSLGVLYLTLEMSGPEMMMRNISAEGSVAYFKLRDNKCTTDEWTYLRDTVKPRIGMAPLLTMASHRISVNQLNAVIHRTNERVPLAAVVVDYMQLLQTNTKLSSRQEQVAELSRELKLSAGQHGLPFYVLAQLNRGPEQRTDKRPQLSDLRESGAVEQDADVVMMVHRPDYYDEMERPGEADIMVVKNRHGSTGTVVVTSQLEYMRFKDRAAY